MAEAVPFTGYPPEALAFLSGLEAENSRTHFEAHRSIYEQALLAPTKALGVDLGKALRAKVSTGLQADPRAGRSLFRINRDLRFTRDPTPYNPWVDVVIWEAGDPRHSPSLILRLGGDLVITGAGIMGMQGSLLERFRRAVANGQSGEALAAVLRHIRIAPPGSETCKPRRARVPAAYPHDHPRAELLRATASICRSVNVDWLASRCEQLAPLHRWVGRRGRLTSQTCLRFNESDASVDELLKPQFVLQDSSR